MTNKKKDFPSLPGWTSNSPNYELEYLRLENAKLKDELNSSGKKLDKSMERDIQVLLQISMKMKNLLEACREQTLPLELGRQIDKVLKEIETYG